MEIVVASCNMHKVRECRSILKKLPALDVLSLADFPYYEPPPETGSSFEENAEVKAVHAAKILKKWVIADDSGLVVPALNGSPGIYSARYAGENATDAENRHKLLNEMRHLEESQRTAYFECAIAIASPQGLKRCVIGRCEGTILTEERGSCGFGYDALFVKHEYAKSFAQLGEEIKNCISHRRKALDQILILLEQNMDGISMKQNNGK